MFDIYQSTMGLSVYNVLSLTREDLPRDRIDDFLRASFDQNIAEDYVDRGVEFLVSEGFATETDGLVMIRRMPDRRGKPIARSGDGRALVWASY